LKSESYYFFWQHFLFQFHLFFCIAVPTEWYIKNLIFTHGPATIFIHIRHRISLHAK
jgi:hypothetical protein